MIHRGCCKLFLDRYEVPTDQRPTKEDEEKAEHAVIVFCTKTCFTKWRAEKNREIKAAKKGEEAAAKKARKVPWEEDGSLPILMEWLTTHGNYASYSGSSGNKGLTKTAYHKKIADIIRTKNPTSERNEKDVENKITSLERQFRQATDWAENTGQGVADPGDFEAAILKRCPFYKELEPIMGERPNARPLGTNEDDDAEEKDSESRNLIFTPGYNTNLAIDDSL